MSLRPALYTRTGTPYPEVTGLICRVPSPGLPPTRLGLLTQGHLCRLWVRSRASFRTGFSRAPGVGRTHPKMGRPFPASPPSRHYGTPGASQVRWGDSPTHPSPRRPLCGLRCRTYTRGAGILTGFPFPGYRLGARLGPPNPRLTTIAEEPLPLRRPGFSPGYAATTTRILVPGGSTGPHGPASTPPRRSPTPCPYGQVRGLGGRLSPVHLRRPEPRGVSFYALLRGWLLLSLPSPCLRLRTTFRLSHLAGTLGP